ncbi:alpha/beta hydrolase family protein [Sphingobacterium siyangense]|uniref:alpha/beta hydrolase family protein n=1 Tax=Sphingobacterium siyangense TaxID=459529 RepID=UPI001F06EB37|nr:MULTISPECIES: prolyl oligopeptidase family serine peptidase [Sphingobacterium]
MKKAVKYKISYLSRTLQYGLFVLLLTIAGPSIGQRKSSSDRITSGKNGVDDFNLAQNMKLGASNLDFHGFEGYSFLFQGREAKIIRPKVTAVGHPWVWRARFWGHEPQVDIGLLEHGYHVVYCDVAELFGNEEALTIWDGFYRKLQEGGLSKKSAMEGMSRGGVYIYNWCLRYPDRVNAIYADAPVLDFKSWPGGKTTGKGSKSDWEIFKKDYGLTETQAWAFADAPIDKAKIIAGFKIPLLHVVGDKDDVVPIAENTLPFAEEIRRAGGRIEIIHKPEVGHHPHCLVDPSPIIDFILKASSK